MEVKDQIEIGINPQWMKEASKQLLGGIKNWVIMISGGLYFMQV